MSKCRIEIFVHTDGNTTMNTVKLPSTSPTESLQEGSWEHPINIDDDGDNNEHSVPGEQSPGQHPGHQPAKAQSPAKNRSTAPIPPTPSEGPNP